MNTQITELLIRYGFLEKHTLPLDEFEKWMEEKLILTTFDDDGNPVRTLKYPVHWGTDQVEGPEDAPIHRRRKSPPRDFGRLP